MSINMCTYICICIYMFIQLLLPQFQKEHHQTWWAFICIRTSVEAPLVLFLISLWALLEPQPNSEICNHSPVLEGASLNLAVFHLGSRLPSWHTWFFFSELGLMVYDCLRSTWGGRLVGRGGGGGGGGVEMTAVPKVFGGAPPNLVDHNLRWQWQWRHYLFSENSPHCSFDY